MQKLRLQKKAVTTVIVERVSAPLIFMSCLFKEEEDMKLALVQMVICLKARSVTEY
jgi:hypothetical protein